MRQVFSPALRIALGYGLFAGLWIVFSDSLLLVLVRDPDGLTRLQVYKGLFFVLSTTVLLYVLLRRMLRHLEHAHRRELESASLLRHYLDVSPAICFSLEVVAGASRAVWVSRNITDIIGFSPEEALVPGWWLSHVHPEDRDRAQAEFEALGVGDSLDHEYRFCRKDGEYLWVRDQLRCLPLAGVPDGGLIVGAWTDITRQKQFERDLRAEANRRRLLFDEARDGISVLDDSWTLVDANDSFAQMVGRPDRARVIGLRPWEWDPDYPDEAAFRQAFPVMPERPGIIETLFRRPDGSVIDVEISFNPAGDGADRVLFSLCRDISERKRAERALAEYSRELTALFNISTSLRMAADSQDLFVNGLAEIRAALGVEDSLIAVPDRDGERFLVAEATGAMHPLLGRSLMDDGPLASLVLVDNGVFVTTDWQRDNDDPTMALPIGPALVAPLSWGEHNSGALAVARAPGEAPFTDTEVRIVTAIGEMLGVALHRIRLTEDLHRRLANIQALRNIDMAIAGSLDLRVILDVALNEICRQLDVDAAAILSFDVHSQHLEYAAGKGFHGAAIERTAIPMGKSAAGRAALEQRMVFAPDPSAGDEPLRRELLAAEQFVAYCAVPLVAKGRTLGVLEVFDREARKRNGDWRALLEILGGQVAIAMDSALLFRDLGRKHQELMVAYEATLEGWAQALALKEEETESHSRRVVANTLAIAREMGIGDDDLVHVRRGALLHDIGKIGIPDAILLKPGKLSAEEWEIMKRHTTYAFEMLSPIPYLRQAVDIPYCHHERWDGSGYPRGLKGKQIPLAARIFAVVDVCDALASERPYKRPWPRHEVMAYLLEERGRHVDPAVVDCFLAWCERHPEALAPEPEQGGGLAGPSR